MLWISWLSETQPLTLLSTTLCPNNFAKLSWKCVVLTDAVPMLAKEEDHQLQMQTTMMSVVIMKENGNG